MAMKPELALWLDRLRAERACYGEALQAPATEPDLLVLAERARSMLGLAPPDAYLDLLRRENGLNHNGLFLYGSADRPLTQRPDITLPGLVEVNVLWRDNADLRAYLLLGDGNLDLYGLHIETGEFRVLDRVPGNVIARHVSCEALLVAAIQAHL